jgi:hypothetical protein
MAERCASRSQRLSVHLFASFLTLLQALGPSVTFLAVCCLSTACMDFLCPKSKAEHWRRLRINGAPVRESKAHVSSEMAERLGLPDAVVTDEV